MAISNDTNTKPATKGKLNKQKDLYTMAKFLIGDVENRFRLDSLCSTSFRQGLSLSPTWPGCLAGHQASGILLSLPPQDSYEASPTKL